MSHDDDDGPTRKGKLSAFALLKSWLFDKSSPVPAHAETEFLNTRDGYELAKFAKKAFGGDAEAERAQHAAVEAEQAEIDALLQGTGAVPMPIVSAAAASGVRPTAPQALAPDHAAARSQIPHAPHPAAHVPVATAAPVAAVTEPPKNPVDVAVRYLEQLRGQGLSVETLAEALIIIESREVRQRASRGQ